MTEDLESPPLDHSGIQAYFAMSWVFLFMKKNCCKDIIVIPVGVEPTTICYLNQHSTTELRDLGVAPVVV